MQLRPGSEIAYEEFKSVSYWTLAVPNAECSEIAYEEFKYNYDPTTGEYTRVQRLPMRNSNPDRTPDGIHRTRGFRDCL